MKHPSGNPQTVAWGEPETLTILVFLLDGREYAVPVHLVIEVARMVAVRKLPEAPHWVDGALNFRGRIVPVVDLRARLGMERREPDRSTSIVITRSESGPWGLVTDDLIEVLSVSPEELDSEETALSPVVICAVRHADRLILVLDADRLHDRSLDVLLPTGAAHSLEGDTA